MDQISEFQPNGEKKIYRFEMKLTKTLKQRLEHLAELNGFTTTSAFVRSKIFQDSMSQEHKLNLIIKKLEKLETPNGGK
jgi:hypothetical protein